MLACLMARRPVVFTLHGLCGRTKRVTDVLSGGARPSASGARRVARRVALRLFLRLVCRAVTVVTASLAEEACRTHRVPPNRVHVIPNCTSVCAVVLDETDSAVPPASADRLSIVWVGRMVPVKRVHLLLAACTLLPTSLRYRVDLVGDGPLRAELQEQARSLGLEEEVTFHGWVEHPEVVLRTADVFVLPSENEGQPLAVIEAMTFGLPAVVMSDGGGATELVDDASCGLLADDGVALAGAIVRLADSPALRAEFGRRGRDYVARELTPERCASRYATLYADVVSRQS
jgi:glycosyltransferase involved in cell wall biosynthesis